MKSLLKATFVCIFVFAVAGLAAAQTIAISSFPRFNPGPCDFSNQFYNDNGLDASSTAELNTEPDGRFGTFRQFGPPATGTQANWVADSTNCAAKDPTRRNFRILATTGGNSDDGNSPFSCADQGGAFAVPQCAGQPGIPETVEFISILAFIHNQNAFIGAPGAVQQNYSRTVGAINGGLDGVQQNDGETISITQGTDAAGNTTGLNPRGISMNFIVSNFEAYASINQKLPNGTFALNPCAADMQSPLAPPTPCFSVADTKDSSGNTISDVATPKLRQDWRFATNRNAMDGSDNNCISTDPNVCASINDSPFGYFCDDLLGMWIITYFWFTQPPNTTDPVCGPVFHAIGNANGFTPDGYPIILTAHELNDELEANGCGAEGQEATDGTDQGAVWLVCPAIPDPRNGAITTDAFLDVVRGKNGNAIDTFLLNQFSCLQKGGKFCFESAPGQ